MYIVPETSPSIHKHPLLWLNNSLESLQVGDPKTASQNNPFYDRSHYHLAQTEHCNRQNKLASILMSLFSKGTGYKVHNANASLVTYRVFTLEVGGTCKGRHSKADNLNEKNSTDPFIMSPLCLHRVEAKNKLFIHQVGVQYGVHLDFCPWGFTMY